MKKTIAALALAALVLGILPAAPGLAGAPDVNIDGRKYTPDHPIARVGDVINWNNNSTLDHTATADHPFQGAFNSGTIAPAGTWPMEVRYAGTYAFKCKFHKKMTGTLRVELTTNVNPSSEGEMVTIRLAYDPLPQGTYFELQERREGRRWNTIHQGRQLTVDRTFHKAGAWDLHVRMVHKASGDVGKWSPIFDQQVNT